MTVLTRPILKRSRIARSTHNKPSKKTPTQHRPPSEEFVHPSFAATPESDPFYYGYRIVERIQPDGTLKEVFEPLTLADYFDPHEGDHFVQNDPHTTKAVSLLNRYRRRYENDPTTWAFYDLKFEWGIPGLSEPAPDLAVVHNLKDKEAERTTFKVVEEGTRPSLIVEIVSPNYPGDDTTKKELYEKVGIPEYIVIDAHSGRKNAKTDLMGWHLVGEKYEKMTPDAQGRLLSRTTNVWFGLDANKRQVILTDAVTGEVLLTDQELNDAYKAAKRQAKAEAIARSKAEQRAEVEARRADALEAELVQLRAMMAQK